MNETNFAQVFAKKLRIKMALRDINQKELAERIGVTPATICLWLQGKSTPRMDKVDELCRLFDVSREYFVAEDDDYYERRRESTRLADELLDNDELRALLSACKGIEPDKLKVFTQIISAMKDNKED